MLLSQKPRTPRRDRLNPPVGYAAGFSGDFMLTLEIDLPTYALIRAFVPRLVDSVEGLVLPVEIATFEIEHLSGAVAVNDPVSGSSIALAAGERRGARASDVLVVSAGSSARITAVVRNGR